MPNNTYDIKLTFSKFKALTNLGQEEFNKAIKILSNLGCIILENNNDYICVKTPSWRHDLHIEEDLIEEILRIIGFDMIQSIPLSYSLPIMQNEIEDKLVDKKTAELFIDSQNIINISDVLSNEFAVLRPTIVASHLKAIIQAQSKSQNGIKIFEIGIKCAIMGVGDIMAKGNNSKKNNE